MSEPFIAEVRMMATNFPPRGWAFCDGQLLSISQNTALFSLIGTIYGGDGRTTTALPDLRGRAVMAPGNGPGLSSRRLGQKEGVETVLLTQNDVPSHSHALLANIEPGEEDGPGGGNALGRSVGGNVYGDVSTDPSNPTDLEALDGAALSDQGGGNSHNNRQPSLGVSFVIALVGIFPPRS